MMKLQTMAALLCVCAATPALADSIDVNLHDKAIRGTYTMQLQSTKGLSAEAGLLYAEDNNNNNDSETMIHGGVLVSGENWSKSGTFDIALGARLLYATPGDLDMLALAFGGRLRFSPIPRLGIGGHFYYAPDITTFMDSDAYQEVGLRVDYQLLPQAFVYIGHRNIKVDFGNGLGEWEMDDHVHVGFKMTF
jgi:hypothetical protein